MRNEARVLERCLESASAVIDFASICDTGSTDGTPEIAQAWLERRGVPGRVHRHEFRDFGHNRTLSILAAQDTLTQLGLDLERCYLLFLDADMVLEIAPEFRREDLEADVYRVIQRNVGLVYPNVRLARASLPARFVGATHEYFAKPSGAREETLETLSIDDRNDGGSRADKYERDIRLLEEELRGNPADVRSMFYLAQTYRGNGDFGKALFWYRRRIAAGGWQQEVWHSQYSIGLMHMETGSTRDMIRAFHAAIRLDPTRGEPFFHLARHLRGLGRNLLAARYARAGLALPNPAGALFVEQDVYDWGLLRELSIAGYYTPFREEGFAAGERLALGAGVPPGLSELATSNSIFYAESLPGAFYSRIAPALPPEFAPCNPSILSTDSGYLVNCRSVSYRLDPYQRYYALDADGIYRTRNFLMRLGRELEFVDQREVVSEIEPLRKMWVQGLEDCRLVPLGGKIAFTCTTTDLHPSGLIQMSLVVLDEKARVERHVPLLGYGDDRPQKNWLPFTDSETGDLRAVYGFEPFVVLAIEPETGRCKPVIERSTGRNLGSFRGSAGPVPLPSRMGEGRLFIVHEVMYQGLRHYVHRFVTVDSDWRIDRVSRPFFFLHKGIEFVCGACLSHDGRELFITLGSEDREAWLCRVPLETVASLLRPLPLH